MKFAALDCAEPFAVATGSPIVLTAVEIEADAVVKVGGRASERHGSEPDSGRSLYEFEFGLNVESTRGATSESFCCLAADGAFEDWFAASVEPFSEPEGRLTEETRGGGGGGRRRDADADGAMGTSGLADFECVARWAYGERPFSRGELVKLASGRLSVGEKFDMASGKRDADILDTGLNPFIGNAPFGESSREKDDSPPSLL